MGASRLRFLAAALALGVVLALAAGSTGLVGGTRAFAAATTLTIIGGDVSVRHGPTAFVAAADGEVLNEGDAVRTGNDGRAVLTYFEGSTVTIEPASEIAIDAASAAPDGGTIVVMTQSAGRTWHVVTKLITGSSKYEVRTPASTASVRGTEFQVDSSSDTTTVTTTEGTVVQHVPDPLQPGATVDVPVTAGTTQTQKRHAPPAPARAAPEPDRKVTVTVGAASSLVVDPLGRSNGVTKDGKLVVQTPGAQVRREGGRIVITLPNVPDGTLTTRIEKEGDSADNDVAVHARVEEKGKALDLADTATPDGARKVAGFEIRRRDDGNTGARTLDEAEKKDLPSAKVGDRRRTSSSGSPEPSGTPRASASERRIELRTLAPRTETPSPAETHRATGTPRATEMPRSASPRASDASRVRDDAARTGAAFVPAVPQLTAITQKRVEMARADAMQADATRGDPTRADATQSQIDVASPVHRGQRVERDGGRSPAFTPVGGQRGQTRRD
ncbi:MAG TPA: FecR family protein [Candidatus Limnocylindria bacterium]|nr:FecR family protein [Candidatus Limnocylindria bacterium]